MILSMTVAFWCTCRRAVPTSLGDASPHRHEGLEDRCYRPRQRRYTPVLQSYWL